MQFIRDHIPLSKFALISIPTAAAVGAAALFWWRTNRRKSFHPVGHVSGLYIYPVKSCKGIALDSALCLAQGLHLDRRWIVLNEKGKVITQREMPALALVAPSVEDDLKTLCLNAPGMDPLKVTLPLNTGEIQRIDVFGIEGEGESAGEEASAWFSKYLDRPGCKLLYMTQPRYLSTEKNWGHECQPDDKAGFGDFAPLLVVTMETLMALNKELETPVSVKRFRPNIIVSGAQAFDEDNWKQLKIRDVIIRKIKHCERCVLTTVDPEVGKRSGKEPLATLRRTRMPEDRDKRYGNSPFFGIHCTTDNEGDIHVGDPVLAKC